MTTQNKRPSVKGKKKISSSDLEQTKPAEQKKPSFLSKRVPSLRPKEEAPDSVTPGQETKPSSEPVDASPEQSKQPEPPKPTQTPEAPEPLEPSGSFGFSDTPTPPAKETPAKVTDSAEKTPKRRSVSEEKQRLAKLSFLTKKWGKKGMACIAAALVILLAAGAFFVWNTYFRYDDAQDIKGEWLVTGGTVVVAIDSQNINMPGDVSYAYTLDDQKKRITFTFSELSGGGEYDFSHGRQVLTISEGNDGSAGVTTFLKISDNTKAKARVISEEESDRYMNELAPQSMIAVEEAAEEEAASTDEKTKAKKSSSNSKES